MGIVELFLIAVGLSMDAFAVSVCKGLAMRRCTWKKGVIIMAQLSRQKSKVFIMN